MVCGEGWAVRPRVGGRAADAAPRGADPPCHGHLDGEVRSYAHNLSPFYHIIRYNQAFGQHSVLYDSALVELCSVVYGSIMLAKFRICLGVLRFKDLPLDV